MYLFLPRRFVLTNKAAQHLPACFRVWAWDTLCTQTAGPGHWDSRDQLLLWFTDLSWDWLGSNNHRKLQHSLCDIIMADIKFTYFDLRVKGEAARLLLAYSGLEWVIFKVPGYFIYPRQVGGWQSCAALGWRHRVERHEANHAVGTAALPHLQGDDYH